MIPKHETQKKTKNSGNDTQDIDEDGEAKHVVWNKSAHLEMVVYVQSRKLRRRRVLIFRRTRDAKAVKVECRAQTGFTGSYGVRQRALEVDPTRQWLASS